MLPLERQNRLLELLKQRQALSVEELCRELYSSGATIRRDLQVLEKSGLLRRTHGGAVYMDGNDRDFPAQLRETENTGQKSIIADKALTYIRDGQTLFMDSSTTAACLAERLTNFHHLRVITNGLKTCSVLSGLPGIQVYCTGGRLRENAQSFVGAQANEFVSRFHADLAFFSCRGVHPVGGITDSNEEEAGLKKQYILNATHSLLLCDASKLNRQFFCKVADLSSVWQIISNIPLPETYMP